MFNGELFKVINDDSSNINEKRYNYRFTLETFFVWLVADDVIFLYFFDVQFESHSEILFIHIFTYLHFI